MKNQTGICVRSAFFTELPRSKSSFDTNENTCATVEAPPNFGFHARAAVNQTETCWPVSQLLHRATVLCLSRDTFPGKRITRQSVNQSINQSVRGETACFIRLLYDLLRNRVCIADDSGWNWPELLFLCSFTSQNEWKMYTRRAVNVAITSASPTA